jgi:Uma2 family endonuclease
MTYRVNTMVSQILSPTIAPPDEQRVLLEGVTWEQYESLITTLGDRFSSLRLSYLDGALEIMTNSPLHEELKKIIGMLIEAYLMESRIRFHAIGSATFRKTAAKRGLEPDECYCLGQKKEIPDLAVEVVLSSGVVDKLAIYEGLGVAEVWVWEMGQFQVYRLGDEGYDCGTKSDLLPGCDLEILARYVRPDDQFDAVMEFRDWVRGL